ncbi:MULTISPECIES: DNA topoisomerase IB [unclassified Bradyrhizobium]|uniref:DNA topoisomerase IB n=1 Tax=unclassified Bradyrhizobium TaxID=2631580 RepID=UPI001BAA2B55|nr:MULTISPECIES: DNA topoisomerase IB [unclassified Bradyrhizobium]MBR1207638.1 DNA topoisomerase IB [Bradyrhizobium sp. AUGA SZCCT0124]MBR1317039.1 DNA topoisomerase IB [Bradyrhizobium sp. AUGA SZCCT0051]MBR1345516.1 DNA topoisomerase IB [Bradyrhizobium sp. AUGA SZCCT0105]MBR1360132.1 DNA topoisomerase IB [Bradyrhizobium sp. AUGA SZCCT0045]
MMDQQNIAAVRPMSADPAVALAKALGQWPKQPQAKLQSPRAKLKLDAPAAIKTSVEDLARDLGLRLGDQNELTIRRIKRGKNYSFVRANGSHVRDARTIRRLHAMAVPPAYRQVRYSSDPSSHLQAVGRDAAGRLQYRYHADWEKVREQRKAHRLAKLVAALPKIRRKVSAFLSGDEPTREFALSAVIELIARTAIRPGNESYARLNGTRGATTLLKSNVTLEDDSLVLTFKAKGGKAVRKECDAAKLVRAIGILRGVPGKRMFQYHDRSGVVRAASTTAVNAFLRELAGIKISLKDFRTLMASAVVVESLSRITPAASQRGRKRQVLDAIRAAADQLSNTPAICRKSYVHDTIVTAFEDGILERFAATMGGYRTQSKREQLLAQVVMAAGA